MVAVARKDQEAAERRTEQIRAQLRDTEILLASHQEQLAELKAVMQQMNSDHEEIDTRADGSSAPTSPAVLTNSEMTILFDSLNVVPTVPGVDNIPPGPPTSFPHLLSTVLRTDLQSYEDFRGLLHIPRHSAPATRVNSGSYDSFVTSSLSNSAHHQSHLPSNGSNYPLSMSTAFDQPQAITANNSALFISSPAIPLKETRFYKRALAEDIEPTLRLETAPGLSWLARRAVVNSMCEGGLVVEPLPISNRANILSCALCGENRKGDVFARSHRFRTSESETAQRYPLCSYCLNRVRSSCGYLGFLRMVKDGHWRTDGEEAERAAWEESVRLRERMFWARIGGGVVPAFVHRESSQRPLEDVKQVTSRSTPSVSNRSILPQTGALKENGDANNTNIHHRPAIQKDFIQQESYSNSECKWGTSKPATIFDNFALPVAVPSSKLEGTLRESLQPKSRSRAASYEKERTTNIVDDKQQLSTTLQRGSPPQQSVLLQATVDQGLQISIPVTFGF